MAERPTPADYLAQCKRRFGTANPERIRSPVWEWIVRERHNPYTARKALKLQGDWEVTGACPMPGNPDWCFQRMGAARVTMPDGRRITVAGEYEDSYDPEFCIYNDVVVQRHAEVEIYGYARDLFPPTDFHTATLVGDRTVICIGGLGYQGERGHRATPVFSLDTDTYRIERLETAGAWPGWIHDHRAVFADGAIELSGGEVVLAGPDGEHWRDNLEDFRLDLATGRWTQTSDHSDWRQFSIVYDEDMDEYEKYRDPGLAWFDGTILRQLRYPCALYQDADDDNQDEDGNDRSLPDRIHTIHVEGVPVEVVDRYRDIRIRICGRLTQPLIDRLLTQITTLAAAAGKHVEEVREI